MPPSASKASDEADILPKTSRWTARWPCPTRQSVREHHQQPPTTAPPIHRQQRGRNPKTAHQRLGAEIDPDEERRHRARDDTEEWIEHEHFAFEREAVLDRDRECRVIAEETVGHDRGDHACDHDRGEGSHRQRSENLFEREERARQWSVERRRNAGRGAGRHEDLGSCRVESERTAEQRARSRAKNRHRTFAAGGPARAERHRARRRAGERRSERGSGRPRERRRGARRECSRRRSRGRVLA